MYRAQNTVADDDFGSNVAMAVATPSSKNKSTKRMRNSDSNNRNMLEDHRPRASTMQDDLSQLNGTNDDHNEGKSTGFWIKKSNPVLKDERSRLEQDFDEPLQPEALICAPSLDCMQGKKKRRRNRGLKKMKAPIFSRLKQVEDFFLQRALVIRNLNYQCSRIRLYISGLIKSISIDVDVEKRREYHGTFVTK